MQGDGTATSVMLGMPGFRVLAVSEYAGELEQTVETTAEGGWCPGAGSGPGCMIGAVLGAGSAGCGSAGDAGVGEAGLALCRAAVREVDVDRDLGAAMLAPRALAVPFVGADLLTPPTKGIAATFVEPAWVDSWLDGWTNDNDACLVGDFLDRGFDQVLFFNRTPEGGRFIIASLSGPKAPEILLAEDWGASDWLDGWDDDAQLQLSGDFMGVGHKQLLLVNRTGAIGRVLIVDFAAGPDGAAIRYFESRGQSPWLDRIDGDGHLRLVGDFAGTGHDQLLFVEHGGG